MHRRKCNHCYIIHSYKQTCKERCKKEGTKLAEEAAATNIMREIYRNNKYLTNKCCGNDKPLKDKKEQLLTMT